MRIDILPKHLNYYKANLHSHSTLSDGQPTPEQMKAAYKEKGYSILAITDHNVFIPHNDMTEADFLMLNGIEYNLDSNDGSARTCHFCAIARDPETVIQPFFHRTKYYFRGAIEARKSVRFDPSKPDYVRTYSHAGISEMMKGCADAGFFVTYNHPAWSLERYPEYMGYEGMHAIEMVNNGCVVLGYPEHNETVYDDMLMGGKRVFCIATDDNHIVERDSFGAYTVIGAPALEYRAVTDALFAGTFYCSTGAAIDEMYIEDGTLYVKTPPAREIRVFTGARHAKCIRGTREKPVTELCFDVSDPRCRYFRVTVTDLDGNCAYSNAYYPAALGVTAREKP